MKTMKKIDKVLTDLAGKFRMDERPIQANDSRIVDASLKIGFIIGEYPKPAPRGNKDSE